jgi:hypothetical protein
VKRTSRSKSERIKVKMLQSSNAGKRSIKSIACRARRSGEWENTLAKQKYTPVFRARAGSIKYISFFLILIGFKG